MILINYQQKEKNKILTIEWILSRWTTFPCKKVKWSVLVKIIQKRAICMRDSKVRPADWTVQIPWMCDSCMSQGTGLMMLCIIKYSMHRTAKEMRNQVAQYPKYRALRIPLDWRTYHFNLRLKQKDLEEVLTKAWNFSSKELDEGA